MQHLKPCMDNNECNRILESDLGGRILLQWARSCRRRGVLTGTDYSAETGSSSSYDETKLEDLDSAMVDPWSGANK
eukprot:CAMPEP_0172610722 /NCGR_PEP_ID=MMETSP1068-20121228/30498_1 /TAXON_ID=35684 /ORGANISM="Pseudopedinella elastica, Strain CCMP716" /LENGTH=75 /DNA_ID=CAMNT_0013414505 /DNA_START=298 /DNA_END=525 /DNA_ORIENTATION=+